jgi:hypothetical protein
MKNKIVLLMIALVVLCSAGYALAFNHGAGREEACFQWQIHDLKAVVKNPCTETHEHSRLCAVPKHGARAHGFHYAGGHHSYDGCRRDRHHY